jgi:hypothetical protein
MVARSEIASAVRSINRVKASRRQTLNNMKFCKVEEVWERIKRNGRRIFGMKKSTGKEIEELWKNAERNLERNRMKRSRHGRSSFSGSSDGSSTHIMNSASVSVKGGGKGRKYNGKRVGNHGSNHKKGGKNPSLDESNHYKRRDIDLHLSRHVKKYDLFGSTTDTPNVEIQKQEDCQDDTVTPTTSNHGWLPEQFDQVEYVKPASDEMAKNDDNNNHDDSSSHKDSSKGVYVSFVGCSDDNNHCTKNNKIQYPINQPSLVSKRIDHGTKYRNDQYSSDDSDGLTLTTASIDLSASCVSGETTATGSIPGVNVHSNVSLKSNPIIAVEEED